MAQPDTGRDAMRRWGFALAVLGLALGGGIEASAAAQGRAPADPQANPEPAPSPQLEQPASSAQSVPDPASIKLVAAQFVDLPLSGDSTSDAQYGLCLLYTSPSPRDATLSRMPSSA